uniref:BTD domain-containing protein n=2 Tax=Panagrellus redivivus TaxID=6233 RepID=A0A7E4V8F5_PANRE
MAATNKPTREKLAEYLADPNKFDCGIAIFNSNVMTKAYDIKKGRFCPPVRVSLFGKGWDKLFDDAEKAVSQPSEQPTSSSTSSEPSKLHFTIDIDQFPAFEPLLLDLSSTKKLTVDNRLYIKQCTGKDYLSVKVNMHQPAKQNPESFLSKRISLVAPVTKENITPKSSSMRILSGSTVAFCNKIPRSSQIRYMHFSSDGLLNLSVDNWSSFTICLVDENSAHGEEKDVKLKEGEINYGSIVKLLDRATCFWLPRMRIMNEIKGVIPLDQIIDQKKRVCELQKSALQSLDNRYMSNQGNEIKKIYVTALNDVMDEIEPSEKWAIMSIDETKYRFYEAMGPVSDPVTPVPTIIGIKPKKTANSDGTPITLVEFTGSNFRKDHNIWFGLHELIQHSNEPNCITCVLPTYDEVLRPREVSFSKTDSELNYPVTITRNDGVIYGTSYYFLYNVGDGSCCAAMVNPLTEFIDPTRLRRI